MQIQNKIQCPNCGATGSFHNESPGILKCGYCGSSFEHISILPDASAEKHFYDHVLEIYNTYVVLQPDRAKYHQRMFSGIMQMHTNIGLLKNDVHYKKVYPKMASLLTREIGILKQKGVTAESGKNLLLRPENAIVEHFYLKHYYKIWAHHLSKQDNSPESIAKALESITLAEQIQVPVPSDFYSELARNKVGLLARGEGMDAVYAYLDTLLETPLDQSIAPDDLEDYKEQIQMDFEDFFLSDGYREYQRKMDI